MNLQGALLMAFVIAGPFALALALAILNSYRSAIRRAMRGASADASPSRPDITPRRAPAARLACATERLSRDRRGAHSSDPSLPAAAVHVAGGVAFGLVATILVFGFSGIEFLPIRFAAVVLGYAWPTVLALNILWTGDRPRQAAVVAVYAAGLIALCLWMGLTTKSQPVVVSGVTLPVFLNPAAFWALTAAPSVYLLVFASRRVRAVGPVVLTFVAFLTAGAVLAPSLIGTSLGWRATIWAMTVIGLSAFGVFALVTLAGAAVGAVLGWFGVQTLARAYESRRESAHGLVTDTIWLIQSLMACSSITREAGCWGVAGLVPFATYKLATAIVFRGLAARRRRPPLRLLLLRVFGFDRRSSRLFDLIGSRWRYLGPIRLIAAPDLASRTIDPGKLFTFVRRRLRALFVHDEVELENRLAQLDERPDPDGRYRVAEFFCAGEIWRSAVKRLMAGTHLVVMDLRNFSKSNEGCAFELQTLLDAAPLGRLMLLVDRHTDVDHLKGVLDAQWSKLSVISPNARLTDPVCAFIEIEKSDWTVVRRLLNAANTLDPAVTPAQPGVSPKTQLRRAVG